MRKVKAAEGIRKRLHGLASELVQRLLFVSVVLPVVVAHSMIIEPSAPELWELFAGSSMLTQIFTNHRASAMEPADLKLGNFDILRRQSYQKTRETISAMKPKLITLAFECTDWSTIHNIMMRKPGYAARIAKRRIKGRLMLRRVVELVHLQLSLGENGGVSGVKHLQPPTPAPP